jgi:hypothetical protein
MVAKINHGNSLYGALAYNQQKVDEGKGQILECNLVMTPADGEFNVYDCVDDFGRFSPSHSRTAKPVVHISLNPHPDDKLTNAQLADIGRQYLEMLGYGGQPWMIFKHEDIDRQHIHLVTTRVKPDGSLVSDHFEKDRSHRIVQQLEKKFGLIPAKGQSRGEAWQLTPVDAAAGDLKRQSANVIKPLSEMYRFRSLSEYRALLSLYNIGVEKVEGENKGNRYKGLVYSVLDTDGQRVGQPLKSSLFGKRYGIEALEQTMLKSGEAVKAAGTVAGMKNTVSATQSDARTGSEFRATLREKGIDLVLRRNDQGRLYGVTYIDHNSRTVLNGSALGKEFSANALSEQFADFSTAVREDLQTPTPPSVRKSQGAPMSAPASTGGASRPASSEHNPATKPSIPALSPIGDAAGSLFSILTPEAGEQDNGQPTPKKRKKKKRLYGRQV